MVLGCVVDSVDIVIRYNFVIKYELQ